MNLPNSQRPHEKVAAEKPLIFSAEGEQWYFAEDHPHLSLFQYIIATPGEPDCDDPEEVALGTVSGYRIAQDWTAGDLDLWEEADACDGDVTVYVESLIREVRCCEKALSTGMSSLDSAQRITIVRHVEPLPGVDGDCLLQWVAASLALMDAPTIMLVDPWPYAEERDTPQGKLAGRGRLAKLLEIGFVRMVGSRFVWAWNRELSELLMEVYDYDALVKAKKAGRLDDVLNTSVAAEVFGGPLSDEAMSQVGLPTRRDLETE